MAGVSSICGISLHMGDKIRLLNFPAELEKPFVQVVVQSWPRGIQDRGLYGGFLQIKLYGNPWFGQGDEAVPCRVLMKELLQFMYRQGWGVAVTCDVSKKSGDKDSIYFKRLIPNLKAQFCVISFNVTDRIRLIQAPQEVQDAVVRCIQYAWRRGIQSRRSYYGSAEIKLYGNPWRATGTETCDARMLVLHLISALDSIGWSVYTSVDLSGVPDHKEGRTNVSHGDLDSWILKSN